MLFNKAFLRSCLAHPVVHNAAALLGLQVVGYVLPLLTFPYLARTLHPQGFGLLLFAQSFGLWSALVVEYGFNFSATREIARSRGDAECAAQTAAGVLGAKTMLLMVVLVCASFAALAVRVFRQHPVYLLLSIPQILAGGFSPFWYFQGTERMVRAVSAEFTVRLMSTGLLFLIVKSSNDGWKVLALQGCSAIAMTAVQTLWMYQEIPFLWPRWQQSKTALKIGWNMFLFRSTYSIFATANAFILGLMASPAEVGFFGAGERISKALQGLSGPLTSALYPRMSYLHSKDPHKAANLVKLTLLFTAGASVIAGVLLLLTARRLILFVLGPGYDGAIPVLQVFALLLPINAMNNGLIMQWLLPLGLDRTVSAVIAGAIGVNICAAVFLAPRFAHIGMAWAVLIAEIFMLLALVILLARRHFTVSRLPDRNATGSAEIA